MLLVVGNFLSSDGILKGTEVQSQELKDLVATASPTDTFPIAVFVQEDITTAELGLISTQAIGLGNIPILTLDLPIQDIQTLSRQSKLRRMDLNIEQQLIEPPITEQLILTNIQAQGTYDAFELSEINKLHDAGYRGQNVQVVFLDTSDTQIGSHGYKVKTVFQRYAPEAEITNIQVLDRNGIGTWSTICDGLDEAINFKPDFIFASVGGEAAESSVVSLCANWVYDKYDIPVIFASGNANLPKFYSPANSKRSIGVTAINPLNGKYELAGYSNHGAKASSLIVGGFGTNFAGGSYFVGTSSATPYFAGILASRITKEKADRGLKASDRLDKLEILYLSMDIGRQKDILVSGFDTKSGYGLVTGNGIDATTDKIDGIFSRAGKNTRLFIIEVIILIGLILFTSDRRIKI